MIDRITCEKLMTDDVILRMDEALFHKIMNKLNLHLYWSAYVDLQRFITGNDKLIKADRATCLKCCYYCSSSECCDYYLYSGKHRGCAVGVCDKFEKGEKKNEKNCYSL